MSWLFLILAFGLAGMSVAVQLYAQRGGAQLASFLRFMATLSVLGFLIATCLRFFR